MLVHNSDFLGVSLPCPSEIIEVLPLHDEGILYHLNAVLNAALALALCQLHKLLLTGIKPRCKARLAMIFLKSCMFLASRVLVNLPALETEHVFVSLIL